MLVAKRGIVIALALIIVFFGGIFVGAGLAQPLLGIVQIGYRIVVPASQIFILTDREYYYSLLDDIRRANSSIMVAVYSMVYDPNDPFDWANNLILELIRAKERGVNVTVIIEYRTYYGYQRENLEAYNYLRANGVSALLDDDSETDHMKLVIIDGYIVYLGSHNWSESALYYNRETSIKIVSQEAARRFNEYFWTIRKS